MVTSITRALLRPAATVLAGAAFLAGAAAVLPASAAPIVFFGENLAPAGGVSGAPVTARSSFLAGLSGGVGTENFEAEGGNVPPIALSFPGSSGGITATLNAGAGGVCDGVLAAVGGIACGIGRYATSGSNYFQTTSTSYSISFDTPISAFGFYGTDVGDFSGQLTVQLDGGTPLTVGHTIGAPNGSLIFWGFIDPAASYSTITFGSTTTSDVFGFDDMTIGDLEQVVIRTPEPGTLAVLGVGLALLGAACRRRGRS